ncbi:MAG TPA: ABC transporter ATP-binding protein [Zoogloea sp.]|mgnify:FL=1|uniref:ABC transporter ATP-binding protein n=1 Tax=Zoogloea sp. TaxID=49181 RepID=UPI002CE1A41A|nr:ABC transporter ATP-binding protein [Zoogloea sp.]HMV17714.1 ABC transporter ATP-binding protein [Rhodocyclaceae bacterium]HMV64032.1 ABC transporter ATP-binding protein [Rhodocyclaceae bacterium]HMW51742.1 ABC transporter ATP-binding protein [Rhodocyclaceae bacterium]HMY50694.1 ABC transporter ATP-binding protein [Rhodocyclaceae bacterium]HMZ76888.1 ABC transporter ATP-binding protein [Rhodocyclaceae bacterium]
MKMDVRPDVLAAEALAVQVGRRDVVRGLEVRVAPGDTLVILGRNGAGKTTLLHTLAGLRPAAGGTVLLSGKPYADWPRGHEACLRGLLPQSQPDFFSATVLETALVGRHPHLGRWAWEGPDDEAIALAALATVGLAEYAARPVLTLSGGERQRLAIAALLVQQPRLYLLDEPLAHLDLHHQIGVLDHFHRLAADGAGVVMVLHDINLAARYASHVLLLDGAGGFACGPARDILTTARLSAAFGHPLRAVADGASTLFVPA